MDFDKDWKKAQNVQKNIKWKELLCLILRRRWRNIKAINSANKLGIGKRREKENLIRRLKIKIILPRSRSSWVRTGCFISVLIHSFFDQQYNLLSQTFCIVSGPCQTFTFVAHIFIGWIIFSLTQSFYGQMFHILCCQHRNDDGPRCHVMHDACGQTALGWMDGKILSRWRKSLETLKSTRFRLKIIDSKK